MAMKAVSPAVKPHANADVRFHCCRFLDRFLEPGILADLIGMLDDPDPRVRNTTLHTLACDCCKEGDSDPTGRKKAAWYAPGGALYRRTA